MFGLWRAGVSMSYLLLPQPVVNPLLSAALSAAALTTLVDNTPIVAPATVPILEVIKIYGKMAGPECFGKQAPKGSSCQVTPADLQRVFGSPESLSITEFQDRLVRADFQWPLKPYGLDKSLSKTATMNKGAETKVFMDELEARGLYDKRNPTGPLPTSLRPQLNRALQEEGVDPKVVRRVYEALGGTEKENVQVERLRAVLGGTVDNAMDYYGFLELLGKETISWPY